MPHSAELLTGLFVAFVGALALAEVAQRLKIPEVVGMILAGVLVGPNGFGWLKIGEPFELIAEIGALMLLFTVGLETKLSSLKLVGIRSFWVGLLGVVLPFALAAIWCSGRNETTPSTLFIAAAFTATSVGITAQVLKGMGALSSRAAQIILGAAIIDDILAMLLLGVVTSVSSGKDVSIVGVLLLLVQAIAFIGIVALLGNFIMRKTTLIDSRAADNESPLLVSFAICLGLALASIYVGLAAIIGAFLAGMVLSESKHSEELSHDFHRVGKLFTPFFFVLIGAKCDLAVLAGLGLVALGIATLLAVIGKFVGAYLAARSEGHAVATIVGIGMVPRGEVGVIVAGLGLSSKALSLQSYGILVGMSVLTAVIAPPLLGLAGRKWPSALSPTSSGPTQ